MWAGDRVSSYKPHSNLGTIHPTNILNGLRDTMPTCRTIVIMSTLGLALGLISPTHVGGKDNQSTNDATPRTIKSLPAHDKK